MLNILTLHQVLPGEPARWECISVDLFEALLAFIVESDLEVTTVGGWNPSGEEAICLSFDDGWSSDFDVVFPRLAERGMSATFFIVGSWVGREGHLDWGRLREMRMAGMEIGSHGQTHRLLRQLSPEETAQELRDSKRILEDGLGEEVASFSYPGGFFSARTHLQAQEVGFRRICTSVPGLGSGHGPILPRNAVNHRHRQQDLPGLVKPSRGRLLYRQAHYWGREVVKRSLGSAGYVRMRNAIFRT